MFDDLPEEVRQALNDANHDHVVGRLNDALHIVAICQQQLRLGAVQSSLQANGDVHISLLRDAAGRNAVPYAQVDRLTRQITVLGNKPAQQAPETDTVEGIINSNAADGDTKSAG